MQGGINWITYCVVRALAFSLFTDCYTNLVAGSINGRRVALYIKVCDTERNACTTTGVNDESAWAWRLLTLRLRIKLRFSLRFKFALCI
jgi:hypothetical protein